MGISLLPGRYEHRVIELRSERSSFKYSQIISAECEPSTASLVGTKERCRHDISNQGRSGTESSLNGSTAEASRLEGCDSHYFQPPMMCSKKFEPSSSARLRMWHADVKSPVTKYQKGVEPDIRYFDVAWNPLEVIQIAEPCIALANVSNGVYMPEKPTQWNCCSLSSAGKFEILCLIFTQPSQLAEKIEVISWCTVWAVF